MAVYCNADSKMLVRFYDVHFIPVDNSVKCSNGVLGESFIIFNDIMCVFSSRSYFDGWYELATLFSSYF